jgi:hypothetical protein
VLAAVLYGISLGNHALTLLLAPGIAVYVLLVAPRILLRWRLVLGCVAALAVSAALVYAYLPLRSAMDPPLDYADPETWERFWYVVLGQQFQGSFTLPGATTVVSGIWDTLVASFGPLALLVPAGVVAGLFRHPRLTALTALWFISTWLFALGYPNAAIERYFAVPLLVAALWLALLADLAWDCARALTTGLGGRLVPLTRGLLAGVLGLALVIPLVLPLTDRRAAVDASADRSGRQWLEAALTALAPDAAVVSWWSFSTPLWYGRWVEDRRPDILILDDRDVLDEGFGKAENAIDHYLPERPVYIVRLDRDLPAFAERYELEPVAGIPSAGPLFRVLARRG